VERVGDDASQVTLRILRGPYAGDRVVDVTARTLRDPHSRTCLADVDQQVDLHRSFLSMTATHAVDRMANGNLAYIRSRPAEYR
jgi:hypothetical protein